MPNLHKTLTEPINRLANFMSNHIAILKKQLLFSLSFLFVVSISFSIVAQNTSTSEDWSMQELYESAARSMALRGIGPAAMGGRISDIKVDPNHPSTWYVAVGSGGVWKTVNSGTTWEAIFDDQASYSIGTIEIDPNNSKVIWVGTGENVSGRHVAWGDGVYKSEDAGKSWEKMGLEGSDHIGRILIDPRNSDVVLVAAEGPLWSSGGLRGVFRTTDGGENWEQVLDINEKTGATDLEFDPSNPEVIYAATYERRRKTWAFLAGGPGSGIHKSTDNGRTWTELRSGLPQADMGKIGLAVTPADPNLVYATIESDPANKGFYRSTDKGESWEKRNSYTSGGTGPHYYQEIEASPTNADVVIQMDVFYQVTRDGGATFNYLETGRSKHSDNHALWIDPTNTEHMLAGSDGGLYESFDEGKTWRFLSNLPIAQFYKIGVDNAEPFYNVVAGAQDLGTLIGPSRTLNGEGIRNQDWYVPLGADGYDAAFDPTDPNIVYMEIQQGVLYRLDRRTEELMDIQPQPSPGDPAERFNWDAPIVISPHDNKTLYFGSQRVWKSVNRGDSWTPISGDLTTNTNPFELPMQDRVPGIDALYDNGAMSKFATLTAIAESPVQAGMLYTGSDDGLIHASEDDGQSWTQAANLPGMPRLSFINDIEASSHDAQTVFVAADAHKEGDYTPYIYRSTNRGKSWKNISGDLPDGVIVWSIKQDPVRSDLLFIGAENGMYFSYNAGENWIKLAASAPTISYRDIELHERDHDLIGGTFGRGIYILDDYSPLRHIPDLAENQRHTIFPVRDAWWYIQQTPMQASGMPSQGSAAYRAPNPPFGATISYYLADVPETAAQQRQSAVKALEADGKDIPFPGWEALRADALEDAPKTLLLIKDASGEPVRWLEGGRSRGFHRTTWDLRLPAPDPISFATPGFRPPWAGTPQGPLAAPGTYSVELYVLHNGKLEAQGSVQEFVVKPIPAIEGRDFEETFAFHKELNDLSRDMSSAGRSLVEASNRLRHIEAALVQTSTLAPELFEQLAVLEQKQSELSTQLYGDRIRRSKDISVEPAIAGRLNQVLYGLSETSLPPTQTHRTNVTLARQGFDQFKVSLQDFWSELETYETQVQQAGAPYTPGRKLR